MSIVKNVQIDQPVTLSCFPDSSSDFSILLLHGFLQNSDQFLNQLKDCFESGEQLLALQAPFPVFRQKPDRYEIGFSWFFYDPKSNTYMVKRDFAIDYCLQILNHLECASSIKKVIGYSQGGYLAPFVADRLSNVDQVVGIHSRFLHEELHRKFPFRLDQIHGRDDQVVDPQNALKSHQLILQRGNRGDFEILDNTGHEINVPLKQKLQQVLKR